MNEAIQLQKIKAAARRMLDSILRDPGGFSLDTLHCMTELGELSDHVDHAPVTAIEGWSMKSDGDEPRFWGSGALVNAESN